MNTYNDYLVFLCSRKKTCQEIIKRLPYIEVGLSSEEKHEVACALQATVKRIQEEIDNQNRKDWQTTTW